MSNTNKYLSSSCNHGSSTPSSIPECKFTCRCSLWVIKPRKTTGNRYKKGQRVFIHKTFYLWYIQKSLLSKPILSSMSKIIKDQSSRFYGWGYCTFNTRISFSTRWILLNIWVCIYFIDIKNWFIFFDVVCNNFYTRLNSTIYILIYIICNQRNCISPISVRI